MSIELGNTLYVAGPMTGIAQFNVPAFDAMAERLRKLGYKVISPVELDSPELRSIQLKSEHGDVKEIGGSFAGETWGEILARDVIVVSDKVDGIVVLPGWHLSRGARLEAFVALLCNKPICYLINNSSTLMFYEPYHALLAIQRGFRHETHTDN